MDASPPNRSPLTRRALLKAGGLALFSVGVGAPGPLFLGRAAAAAPGPAPFGRRKVLVALFQRGAMDGLMAVTPLREERRLARLRPSLAMPGAAGGGAGRLLDLGVGFGLHPAFGPLLPLWQEGRLAVVHAVGSPDPTRSHFDAQDYMETGTPGRRSTASGWLNRVSGLLGHEATPFRSVALARAMPRSLDGPEPAIAVADLAELQLGGPDGNPADAGRALEGDGGCCGPGSLEVLYRGASHPHLRATAREAFAALGFLERLDPGRYRPARGAAYPASPLGHALRQIAMLIKAEAGLEVAFAESSGWDTHVRQGTVDGSFARRAADLGRAIAAFWTDLGPYQDDVVLLTMTEFGRAARENGSGGTDHGHGSCLFVIGNRVDGGRVHGEFPGLDPAVLHQGRDLPVTTDFRAVFSEVAGKHLGVGGEGLLFPGWSGPALPLVRA